MRRERDMGPTGGWSSGQRAPGRECASKPVTNLSISNQETRKTSGIASKRPRDAHETCGPVISALVLTFAILTMVPWAARATGTSHQQEAQPQPHGGAATGVHDLQARQQDQEDQNGFQLHELYALNVRAHQRTPATGADMANDDTDGASLGQRRANHTAGLECPNGLLTFELATGFIYKPTSAADTLSMMPSTLQLTDCLDYCLHNTSCLAINFEMGLCVLLATSAKQNQHNLYSSQFPVFTIYAEKKCLLSEPGHARHRRRCQRAWTFERVAGYEMKIKARRRLKLATKELCMDACLVEHEFECRSANWHRATGECALSDQDRHSVSQSEAGDQQIKASLSDFYGPSNSSAGLAASAGSGLPPAATGLHTPTGHLGYQNFYASSSRLAAAAAASVTGVSGGAARAAAAAAADASGLLEDRSQARAGHQEAAPSLASSSGAGASAPGISGALTSGLLGPARARPFRQLYLGRANRGESPDGWSLQSNRASQQQQQLLHTDLPASAQVDYLENNCVYEPNKLCEFRKIQNKVLKTVDSIYQDVASLDECRQKCLSAPYRCYSFDYGDTSERVCRTSHLDQASLLSVNEPYLEVVGAITYELAACFNVSIQCRAREMVALVSSSKSFNGKIYAKSRPTSCVNDVKQALQFELSMRYHDDACDVRATSNQFQGVFSQDIVIQHHDRIVTTQDVGLSVYCQYDLGNRSVTNNVDLAIERLPDGPVESKQHQHQGAGGGIGPAASHSPLTITGLATTVVRSPNVTMRITNMNGLPVTSATVGDRLALMFEIKEKTSPFGIFVREIVAMDGQGRQLPASYLNASQAASQNGTLAAYPGQHYASSLNSTTTTTTSTTSNSLALAEAAPTNSIQFLDSDGCPTDANLMGPLVRMDPHGHRLLAPFDAFKFPSSDMVFFRAVVSSCVAECKPAVCPAGAAGDLAGPQTASLPGGGGGGGGGGFLADLVSTASSPFGHTLAMSSLAPSDTDDADDSASFVATTRNMQTSSSGTSGSGGASTPAKQQPISSTTTTTASPRQFAPGAGGTNASAAPPTLDVSSTPLPDGQQLSERSTVSAPGRQESSGAPAASGDSLTTVAGFTATGGGQSTSASPATTEPSSPAEPARAAVATELSRAPGSAPESAPINMTNNHNLGRPSLRPLTTTTTAAATSGASGRPADETDLQQFDGSSARHPAGAGHLHPPPPPPKLDPLTAQERQAILNLLSGHDKSGLLSPTSAGQSGALSGAGASPSQLYNEETITSGLMKLYPILDSFRHGNSRSRSVALGAGAGGQQQQPMSSRMVLDEIRAIISDKLEPTGSSQQQQPQQQSGAATADASGQTRRSHKSKRSNYPFADNREFVQFINRTLIDYIIAEELKSLLLTQMLLDETRNALAPAAPPAAKSGRALPGARGAGELQPQLMFPLERLNKFYDTMGWPRIATVASFAGDQAAAAAPTSPPALSFVQAERLVRAQFDSQLAAQIQHILKLLDQSKPLDAKQEIRRQKRQVQEQVLRSASDYVYLHQPGRLASGHVEMYRALEARPRLHARFRRQTMPEAPESEFEAHHELAAGPRYEMDEMVVQSIKIVDRLQFEDDLRESQQEASQRSRRPASPGNRSLAGSGTSAPKRWQQRQLRPRRPTNSLGSSDETADETAQLSDSPAAGLGGTNGPSPADQLGSRLSAFNIMLVALCFIFIQVSMVLVCMIDCAE